MDKNGGVGFVSVPLSKLGIGAGQFRLEGINAANHVQFADPNTSVTSSAFGSISAEKGHGQRQVNFVFKLLF